MSGLSASRASGGTTTRVRMSAPGSTGLRAGWSLGRSSSGPGTSMRAGRHVEEARVVGLTASGSGEGGWRRTRWSEARGSGKTTEEQHWNFLTPPTTPTPPAAAGGSTVVVLVLIIGVIVGTTTMTMHVRWRGGGGGTPTSSFFSFSLLLPGDNDDTVVSLRTV